ncbi:MAG TPA: hypothetical protein PLU71_05215 [Candidatus Dependentiae bacterium]|nr:hypothetical protein [Candidatus Dependentiae bacterium]HRQ63232.1 hypothetical protein [Candidatus Dependentiae bacterium]
MISLRRQWLVYVICCLMILPFNLYTYDHHTETLIATIQQRYEQTRQQIANDVLLSVPNEFEHIQPIITSFEWRELQVDNLVNKLNKTVTAFGQQGLKWLLCPITDSAEIERRQTIIKTLVEDTTFFSRLDIALRHVKQGEDALLLYWDQKNPYHEQVKKFFYRLLPKKINNVLNNNRYALDFGFLYTVCVAARMLVHELCLGGIYQEFSDFEQQDIDLMRGLKRGLGAPLDIHNCVMNKLYTGPASVHNSDGSINWKRLLHVSINGTAKDRHGVLYDLFGQRTIGSILGWSSAAFSALSYDVFWYLLLEYAWDEVKERSTIINATQRTLSSVARLMQGLKELEAVVASNGVLRDCKVHRHLQDIMNMRNWSNKFKQLMALLYSSTFDASGSWTYSRGKVLCAHKLLLEIRQELVPALQAVAQYDAYFSIAQLFKEHQGQETGFCFVQFVEHPTPYVDIEACWEPLVPGHAKITNDIQLGVHGIPMCMVITGPNGGGKSTFLKSLGHAVIMAQSWGIVPAQSARMTMFHGIRTSLDPKEDLSQGISTFMAQKKRIKELYDYLTNTHTNDKILAMLDEPFRGTTDYQSAQRIYAFGKDVTNFDHAIVCIATHVRKPIELAQEYPAIFANYNVIIEEPEQGEFIRTFKLAHGPAMWWFDDQACASRFVDWLDIQMRKQAMLQESCD